MNKRSIMLLMLLVALLGAQAQMAFSLEEAVDYALENNKQLNSNRYNVEKSESAYKETRAGWMPQVDASIDYMTYFGYEAEFSFGSDAPTFLPEDYINAGLAADAAAGAVPGSGAFDLSQHAGGAAYDSYLTSTLPPTTIDMGGSSTAQVQVGQMLFNGQLLSGIRAAKIGMSLAAKGVELTELEVRSNVANTYYSALTLQATLSTIDSSLKEMESLYAKTEVIVRTGMMEQTELDQLKVQMNNLRNTKLAMGRNVQITYNLLRFHLGLPVNSPIDLTDDLDLIMEAITGESALTQNFDITENLNYQLMDKQVELTEEMVSMEKMAYAPTITAFYAYNAKLLTSGFDMNPNNMAGATMSIPIFSSGQRKNRVEQQQIELLQAEADKDILKDNLYLQESQLRFDYVSKFEEYQNQKENVEVARRVYESYERKFSQGVASGMDLTNANSTYLQAEGDYLTSILSLLQARVSFFKLMNTL